MKRRITIFGDICPSKETIRFFESGDSQSLLGDVKSIITRSDFSICNMEFPVCDQWNPIEKTGPILGASTSAIRFFKNAGFSLLSLANNHIKDLGEEGVLSTLNTAKDVDISTTGAAENLMSAKKGYIHMQNGIKIGVLAFAEQEFNTATENSAGANYFDPYVDIEYISELKSKVDYLIILYHGGIEYYKNPSPLLQKKCRKFVDAGADLVTCQHSHCIGTFEEYKSSKIVYGQGNSVFGYRKNSPSWNEGLVLNVELTVEKDKLSSDITYKLLKTKSDGTVTIDSQKNTQLRLAEFESDSRRLDEAYIANEWQSFCEKQSANYLAHLFGFNRVLIHINRFLGNRLVKIIYPKNRSMITHNLIRCEAHNEVVQTLLDNKE